MNRLTHLVVLGLLVAFPARAVVLYNQPHNGNGTLHKSSWYPPDGLDGDAYCWDGFSLGSSNAVTTLTWRGGYEYHPSGTGQSPVTRFSVAIYRSIAGNSQPDLGAGGRLVRYYTSGNAGETPAGSFGGVAMFDYSFTLPSAFQATAGAVYWVQIYAEQGIAPPSYAPDWGLAVGAGGNGSHFRFITGGTYQFITGDLAFALQGSSAPTVTINASALPAYAGSVNGAGSYPVGTNASLTAAANAGYGFVNWTENGTQVSVNPTYNFTATTNRTLVANFDTAYVVTTASWPPYAGVTTGDGTYVNGQTVTVTATANPGFVFAGWSDGATTPTHTFPAAWDTWITAFFDPAPWAVTYDFDNSAPGTPLPLNLSEMSLGASFTGNYSVQAAGVLGFTPQGFTGNILYPGSVFSSDLTVSFTEHLTYFSIMYAPAEIGCGDGSATMRLTALLDGVQVATMTGTVPVPGTYPTGTLSIAVPGGFDSAVVHWDHMNPGCGDYAPIFLADVVTVIRDSTQAGAPEPPAPGPATLAAPAPNPFDRSTTIRFTLPAAGPARIDVYDLSGRLVRRLIDAERPAGAQDVTWDGATDSGRPAAAGIYLIQLDAGGMKQSRRVILMK